MVLSTDNYMLMVWTYTFGCKYKLSKWKNENEFIDEKIWSVNNDTLYNQLSGLENDTKYADIMLDKLWKLHGSK